MLRMTRCKLKLTGHATVPLQYDDFKGRCGTGNNEGGIWVKQVILSIEPDKPILITLNTITQETVI